MLVTWDSLKRHCSLRRDSHLPGYESNGMYFSPSGEGQYKVVPPPAGALEPQLPSGAKPVKVGEQTLYEVQGVYYQPTIQNGQKGYMVVTP